MDIKLHELVRHQSQPFPIFMIVRTIRMPSVINWQPLSPFSSIACLPTNDQCNLHPHPARPAHLSNSNSGPTLVCRYQYCRYVVTRWGYYHRTTQNQSLGTADFTLGHFQRVQNPSNFFKSLPWGYKPSTMLSWKGTTTVMWIQGVTEAWAIKHRQQHTCDRYTMQCETKNCSQDR